LRQVFFDPQRHGPNLQRDIASARRALASGANSDGDSTLLPPEMRNAPQSEVERSFGAEFTNGLKALPLGGWQGPLRSTFGLHLVRLDERSGGHAPALEQVRAQVERDLFQARAEQSNEAVYDKLRANYRVRVESASLTAAPAG
jgi:hypothetical protein